MSSATSPSGKARLQHNRACQGEVRGLGGLLLRTEGTFLAAWPRLPAAQRSSPSWRKHTWLALQDVGLQVMLLGTEHVQRVVQVFSVYQLSPNCGAWPSSAEPIGNLETGDGWSPPQPRRVTAFGPFSSPIFLPSSPPSFPSPFSFLPSTIALGFSNPASNLPRTLFLHIPFKAFFGRGSVSPPKSPASYASISDFSPTVGLGLKALVISIPTKDLCNSKN